MLYRIEISPTYLIEVVLRELIYPKMHHSSLYQTYQNQQSLTFLNALMIVRY